jgi:hypothetical protein
LVLADGSQLDADSPGAVRHFACGLYGWHEQELMVDTCGVSLFDRAVFSDDCQTFSLCCNLVSRGRTRGQSWLLGLPWPAERRDRGLAIARHVQAPGAATSRPPRGSGAPQPARIAQALIARSARDPDNRR